MTRLLDYPIARLRRRHFPSAAFQLTTTVIGAGAVFRWWGLTTMRKRWPSGDHAAGTSDVETYRIEGLLHPLNGRELIPDPFGDATAVS